MNENERFLKMKGVLAVPGEYTKDDKKYIKTAEELKDAAERYPIIPITFGHTNNSEPPPPSQQIGTAKQKWSEEHQKALAEYWFDKKKMPEILKERAYRGERLPVSTWFLADSMDEDGTLHGLAYSHVAALEGEDPVCPLDQCGAFVIAESKTSQRLIFAERLEDLETTQTAPQEKEVSPEPTPDEAEAEQEAPKTESPAEENLAESDEQAPKKEEEVILEPETVIPAEVPTTRKNPLFDVIDGKYVFVPQAFKQKQEKK